MTDRSTLESIERASQMQRDREGREHAQAEAQRAQTQKSQDQTSAAREQQKPNAAPPITDTKVIGVLGADLLEQNAVSKAQKSEELAGRSVGPNQREQESRGGFPASAGQSSGASAEGGQGSGSSTHPGANRSGRENLYNKPGQNSGPLGTAGYFDSYGDYHSGTDSHGTPTGGVGVDGHGREVGAYGQFTRDIVGRGDGSAEAGNTRVICTELVRQGLMPPNLQRLDIAFTLKHLSPATVRGYHFWAVPYVRVMKRSALATRCMEPLARWRAEEIAYRMKARTKPHWRGRVVRLLGEPVCWVLGTVLGWTGDPMRFYPKVRKG